MPNPLARGRSGATKHWLPGCRPLRTYIAIVAEAHPERVRDMLAYMRLVVREAGKFSGTGWLTYDSIFRRNNEGQEQRWNYLDASLHQVYIAGWRDKVAAPCRHCHEIDHTEMDCAMAAIRPKTMAPISDPSTATGLERGGSKGKRPVPYSRQRPICTSWNAGNCRFPGKCTYAHVCSHCKGSHPASLCLGINQKTSSEHGKKLLMAWARRTQKKKKRTINKTHNYNNNNIY